MNPLARDAAPVACAGCLRRAWLLATLSPLLDYAGRDRERLLGALSLEDQELMAALAGSRRQELAVEHARFDARAVAQPAGIEAVCRHNRCFPPALKRRAGPRLLHVAGGHERLAALCRAPVIALAGGTGASDYGVEVARCLGRGLSAAGVTVASGTAGAVALAAQGGALEAGGNSLAVLAGAVDRGLRGPRRGLLGRVCRRGGCAIAELPSGAPARRWGALAADRVLAQLAQVTVLVEARDDPGELAQAQMARAFGRRLAAVPGRVSSPLSTGPLALIRGGADLVRGPADVLELLDRESPGPRAPQAELEPLLKRVLELVGAGCDTAGQLELEGLRPGDTLLALTELELLGLLCRGDGGRYLLRTELAARLVR